MSTRIRCVVFELRRRGGKKKNNTKRTQERGLEKCCGGGGGRLDRLSDDLGISRDLEPGDEFAAVRQRKKERRGQEKQHQALRSTGTLLQSHLFSFPPNSALKKDQAFCILMSRLADGIRPHGLPSKAGTD